MDIAEQLCLADVADTLAVRSPNVGLGVFRLYLGLTIHVCACRPNIVQRFVRGTGFVVASSSCHVQ
jgi:hypothetical protein